MIHATMMDIQVLLATVNGIKKMLLFSIFLYILNI